MIFVYIFMLRIAGQTAGPIGLKFFGRGGGGVMGQKNSIMFFQKKISPRATPGPTASHK